MYESVNNTCLKMHFIYNTFLDYWAIMHSQSRQSLFISYPSLNTHLNERQLIFAYHQIDFLADECEAIFENTEAFLQKHLNVMNPLNESGLSLRRLVSLQITIVKFKDDKKNR